MVLLPINDRCNHPQTTEKEGCDAKHIVSLSAAVTVLTLKHAFTLNEVSSISKRTRTETHFIFSLPYDAQLYEIVCLVFKLRAAVLSFFHFLNLAVVRRLQANTQNHALYAKSLRDVTRTDRLRLSLVTLAKGGVDHNIVKCA